MKFIIDNWPLIAIAIASGSMLLWPVLQGAAVSGVTPDVAVRLMNHEKAVVIDIRESSAFAAGHIGAAKSIPLADFETKLSGAVKNKSLPLILVCQSGTHSARAVAMAKKLGYEQAQSLAGGMTAWKTASLPVEKS